MRLSLSSESNVVASRGQIPVVIGGQKVRQYFSRCKDIHRYAQIFDVPLIKRPNSLPKRLSNSHLFLDGRGEVFAWWGHAAQASRLPAKSCWLAAMQRFSNERKL